MFCLADEHESPLKRMSLISKTHNNLRTKSVLLTHTQKANKSERNETVATITHTLDFHCSFHFT